MSTEQSIALVKLLELTVHSQIDKPWVAHHEKLQLLDALHEMKLAFGLVEEEANE